MNESKGTGNVVAERVILEDDHFKLFDQLPKIVREELANAAYSMAAEKIVAWVNECRLAGMEELPIAELVVYRFRQYLRDKIKSEAARLYGPEHPQSGPH